VITPEDAAVLLRAMVEGAMAALDATDTGEQLPDEQYSAIRGDLDEALAEILGKRLRITS